jgi:hypothetical protein
VKRIRCDLGPVPYEGYDPQHMVGETVRMDVPLPASGAKLDVPVCKVVDAWVKDRPGLPSGEDDDGEPAPVQWLAAEIEVPDWLADTMFALPANAVSLGGPVDKMLPLKAIKFPRATDVIDDALRREGFNMFDPLENAKAALRVHRHGTTHRVTRVVRGGFSTRYRVQWARGIWRSLKSLRSDYLACLTGHFEVQDEEDRRAHCPHLEEWREPLSDTEYMRWDICRGCNEVFHRDEPRIEYPSGTRG